MENKIAVLTGSSRLDGNSSTLAEIFSMEAARAGMPTVRFDSALMKVERCVVCNSCFSKGKPCIVEDDFNPFCESLAECSALLIATPVYWYTFPGKLKMVIDKFYAYCHGSEFPIRRSALIACCEDDPVETFDGMLFAYRKTIALLNCISVGEVLVPGIKADGNVMETDAPKKVRQLVKKFLV